MKRRALLGLVLGTVAASILSACFPLIAGGMFTGALVATDRRTAGIVIEDHSSELRISNRISTKYGDDAHVNPHSFNRIVLLTGEVRNADVRQGVEDIAKASENVRTVVNETQIGPNSALADRASDTLLANKVRARYLGDGHFSANIVATVVERHEVFLMGLVTQAEGDEIVNVAKNTSGVARVVKVFEYVDPASLPQPAPKTDSKPALQ